MWEERSMRSASLLGRVEFSGTPFMIVGTQTFECLYGRRSDSDKHGAEKSVIYV